MKPVSPRHRRHPHRRSRRSCCPHRIGCCCRRCKCCRHRPRRRRCSVWTRYRQHRRRTNKRETAPPLWPQPVLRPVPRPALPPRPRQKAQDPRFSPTWPHPARWSKCAALCHEIDVVMLVVPPPHFSTHEGNALAQIRPAPGREQLRQVRRLENHPADARTGTGPGPIQRIEVFGQGLEVDMSERRPKFGPQKNAALAGRVRIASKPRVVALHAQPGLQKTHAARILFHSATRSALASSAAWASPSMVSDLMVSP